MALSQVKLPQKHAELLRLLASKPDDETSQLTAKLADARPELGALSDALDGYVDDKRLAITALLAFSTYRLNNGLDVDEGLESISEQFEGVDLARLKGLLEADSLVILAKAVDLATAHDKVLDTARIVTDIRPIFRDAVESGPVAYTIGHELILSVMSVGEPREIYVSVDAGDLEDLREQIDRAMKKHEQLSTVVNDRIGSMLVRWGEE